jgi:hypothetical protein
MSANAYKRLNISDNFVVPYTANKSWDILSSSFAEKSITINVGINTTNSLFNPINEYKTNGQYDRLVYNSVNTIYYPNSLPYQVSTSSRQGSSYNDGTLSTSSYFNGLVELGNSNTIKFYPTGNGAIIYAINVPRSLSSDKILPTTFEVDFASGSNTYKLYDDGNYNLLFSGSNVSSSIGTILSQSSYVGNIFYEQNIAILTIIPNSVRLRGWQGLNPVCEVASPSVTPTVTPTISITATPAVTPTISVTPTVTKTATPSVTPTISVTPSVTKSPMSTPSPTKTLPPTITPTPTISITPTSSRNKLNLLISNISNAKFNRGGGTGVIKSVSLNTGAIFYTYDPSAYSFPLYGSDNPFSLPSDLWGTLTSSGTSAIIRVYIELFPDLTSSANFVLSKNGSAVSTKSVSAPINGSTTLDFDAITWTTSDSLKITYEYIQA